MYIVENIILQKIFIFRKIKNVTDMCYGILCIIKIKVIQHLLQENVTFNNNKNVSREKTRINKHYQKHILHDESHEK